jgi:hypothetical protein
MAGLHPHDVVELERDFGRWPAGTFGAVIEVVGPGGETLDLLELPAAHVRAAEPR